ncbi:hypothetical protein Iz_30 [Brucella phage Iz]|nr:hypothetical protein Iz_30 [Brucella phage Iz]
MVKKLTLPFMLLMTMVLFACSSTAKLTSPCDVLVLMSPSEQTARYIVENDRPFAQQVAQHRGRYGAYKCQRMK